jgi:hypothetical protein
MFQADFERKMLLKQQNKNIAAEQYRSASLSREMRRRSDFRQGRDIREVRRFNPFALHKKKPRKARGNRLVSFGSFGTGEAQTMGGGTLSRTGRTGGPSIMGPAQAGVTTTAARKWTTSGYTPATTTSVAGFSAKPLRRRERKSFSMFGKTGGFGRTGSLIPGR